MNMWAIVPQKRETTDTCMIDTLYVDVTMVTKETKPLGSQLVIKTK